MAEDQAPVEAPKIKPRKGWTVDCVKLKIVDEFPDYWLIEFGDGTTDEISKKALVGLPWLPPAPVLRVGGRARVLSGAVVNVCAIQGEWALGREGPTVSPFRVSDLTPLEDEG
jgi:hypothetical protein